MSTRILTLKVQPLRQAPTNPAHTMLKKLSIFALLALTAMGAFAQSTATKTLYKKFTDPFETKADTMTEAFVRSYMVLDKGYFNDMYKKYAFNAYWTQAHAIDVVIYNYERNKNINKTLASRYLNYIKLWYKNKGNNYAGAAAATSTTPNTTSGYKMFENPFTDDMCWITLTLLRIGEATGTEAYSTVGRQVFDNYIIKRGKEDAETGGIKLPWNTNGGDGPNACTQSPATLIAAKLYQKYGDQKYLDYAKKLYAYTAKKIVFSDGRVEDPPLTYTQGTFGEACRILYHVTDESASVKAKYKSLAYTYINYAFTSGRCTNGSNILRHEGTSGDQSIFKAVLIPYAVNFVLDDDMTTANRTAIMGYIKKNVDTLWRNMSFSRYPNAVFCNFDWTKPWTGADSEGSMGAMCSGASLIENYARLCNTLSNRYNLGVTLADSVKVKIVPGYESDEPFAAYTAALQKGKEIAANPGKYQAHEFKAAIEALQTAIAAAMDYATPISQVSISDQENRSGVFDLNGRLVRTPWQSTDDLPRGLYIIGGRKVLKN